MNSKYISPDRLRDNKSIRLSNDAPIGRPSIYRRDNPPEYVPSDHAKNIFSPQRGVRESTFRRIERASTTHRNADRKS